MVPLAWAATAPSPPPTLSPGPLLDNSDNDQWPVYGGDAGGTRYSDQKQIDNTNVKTLKIAWQYRTGEMGKGFARADKLAFEATPILVNGIVE
jgi:quinoprotein glucose dehydrogenase